ncbi:ATP synthase F0 subunit C [Patescibacteria group bacterium]|nr:ATP synthase F0 subunit C [Patescibacteria group bacterium]
MALVESAAIYGLIIALQITSLDPTVFTAGYKAIAAGAAIGAAGLGAGVGEGLLVAGALEAIWKSPEAKGKIMTFMILFLALVESVAIY